MSEPLLHSSYDYWRLPANSSFCPESPQLQNIPGEFGSRESCCGRGVSVEYRSSSRWKRNVLFNVHRFFAVPHGCIKFFTCRCILQVTAAHTLLAGKSYVK